MRFNPYQMIIFCLKNNKCAIVFCGRPDNNGTLNYAASVLTQPPTLPQTNAEMSRFISKQTNVGSKIRHYVVRFRPSRVYI